MASVIEGLTGVLFHLPKQFSYPTPLVPACSDKWLNFYCPANNNNKKAWLGPGNKYTHSPERHCRFKKEDETTLQNADSQKGVWQVGHKTRLDLHGVSFCPHCWVCSGKTDYCCTLSSFKSQHYRDTESIFHQYPNVTQQSLLGDWTNTLPSSLLNKLLMNLSAWHTI